jgi:hypothetical protein
MCSKAGSLSRPAVENVLAHRPARADVLIMPLWVTIWAFRALFLVGLVILCMFAGSSSPTLGFALAWGPNGLFLALFTKGQLRLPRWLEPVHPIEPILYRWLGVRFVKRIVATRMWPLVIGFEEPPPKPTGRQELLHHVDMLTKGAEVCHAATFVLASVVALACALLGRTSAALWILVFNVVLNAYPVMLQRANRWRVHRIRPLLDLDGAPMIREGKRRPARKLPPS